MMTVDISRVPIRGQPCRADPAKISNPGMLSGALSGFLDRGDPAT